MKPDQKYMPDFARRDHDDHFDSDIDFNTEDGTENDDINLIPFNTQLPYNVLATGWIPVFIFDNLKNPSNISSNMAATIPNSPMGVSSPFSPQFTMPNLSNLGGSNLGTQNSNYPYSPMGATSPYFSAPNVPGSTYGYNPWSTMATPPGSMTTPTGGIMGTSPSGFNEPTGSMTGDSNVFCQTTCTSPTGVPTTGAGIMGGTPSGFGGPTGTMFPSSSDMTGGTPSGFGGPTGTMFPSSSDMTGGTPGGFGEPTGTMFPGSSNMMGGIPGGFGGTTSTGPTSGPTTGTGTMGGTSGSFGGFSKTTVTGPTGSSTTDTSMMGGTSGSFGGFGGTTGTGMMGGTPSGFGGFSGPTSPGMMSTTPTGFGGTGGPTSPGMMGATPTGFGGTGGPTSPGMMGTTPTGFGGAGGKGKGKGTVSATLDEDLVPYNINAADYTTPRLENDITEIIKNFDLDLDEDIDLTRINPDKRIDDIFSSISQKHEEIISLLRAYNMPFPIIKLLIRKIIKLTLSHGKREEGEEEEY